MPPTLQAFDMSVTVTPPSGYLEPLPITLGPNWQPNDTRLVLVSGSGTSADASLEMKMHPDPPTGFSTAYALNQGIETHGVYYRLLSSGDTDNVSVAWAKPTGWQYFMFGLLTVRGVSPTVTPTAGWLHVSQTGGDTTAVAQSVTVPGPGTMVFFAGSVPSTLASGNSPTWAVSLGCPSGWKNLVATDKSGVNFFQYGTDPSLVVVSKTFTSSGSTGSVAFPTAQGQPAFMGLYVFLTSVTDVSTTLAPV